MSNTGTNKKTAVFYALSMMGSNISWFMINNYLMLFYTDVVGLTASAISLIMLLARVWDAVNDPMMGVIIDRTESRWGKFRPYIVIGAPFLALFNVLTFTVFPLQGATKAVVCFICYIGAGMAYTVVGTAVNGIVNRLSKDSQTRMNLTSIGMVAQSIMNMLLSAGAMTIILRFSAGDAADAHGFFIGAIIFSLISLPFTIIGGIGCKEIPASEMQVVTEKTETRRSLGESFRNILKNKQLLITVWSVITGSLAVAGRMSLLSYYLIYVCGSYTLIAPAFTIMTAAQIAGNAVVPWGTRKFGKRNFLIIMMLLQAASTTILFFGPATNTAFVLGITVLVGFANAFYIINYGMIFDCVDYGELHYGTREEALSTTFLTLGVKIATAVVGAGGVLLLNAIGYVPNEVQAASVQTGISFIVNVLPAILIVISIIPLIWYKLDNKAMDEIHVELNKKRGETETE